MMLEQSNELSDTACWLRTRCLELREQFVTLRQGYFLIVCAWCRRRLGWKRKQASVPGETSHSICQQCAVAIGREIAMPTVSLTQAVPEG
jgi:hypothetical protein